MVTEHRLIYANEVEAKMCGLCDEFGTDHLFIDAIVYEIGNAPTVDAVEVVRCKECVGWCPEEIAKKYGVDRYCTLTRIPTDADDFCSYGEKKK